MPCGHASRPVDRTFGVSDNAVGHACGQVGLASRETQLEPKVKLWMEKDGLLAFSDYRAELLQQIAETGSLAEGAQRMGLSYRRAWGKIKEIERNLGVRLVQSEAGGPGGGRTRLTPEGEQVLARYRAFRAAVRSDVSRDFAEVFGRGV